jgi:hypothetical protein
LAAARPKAFDGDTSPAELERRMKGAPFANALSSDRGPVDQVSSQEGNLIGDDPFDEGR